MSLTPLDESDRKPREGGSSADDGRDDGGLAILGRVRDALGRVAAALTGGSTPETTVEPQDNHGTSGVRQRDRTPLAQSHSGSDARAAERSLTWASDASGDPPDPGEEVDRPDLVATWDDRGLTLSEASDSGATISSDTWTDIER
jgi:hypothetical protein